MQLHTTPPLSAFAFVCMAAACALPQEAARRLPRFSYKWNGEVSDPPSDALLSPSAVWVPVLIEL